MYLTNFGHLPGFRGHWLTPELSRAESAKTFNDWGGAKPSSVRNQQPQHPPLYYKGVGLALRVERKVVGSDAQTPLRDEWWFLRLIDALMVLPVPLLAWAAARRLGASDAVALTAAATPLAVPQLLHIGGAINNDNLLILLCGVLAVLVAGVLRGETSLWSAVVIGVLVGLAALTKAFALALVPWVALAYVYTALRTGTRWKQGAVGVLVSGGTAALIGGWWYIRNLMRYGKLAPSTADTSFATSRPGFEPDPIWYLRHFTTSFIQRFWGDFGRYQAPMTTTLVVAATIFAAAAIIMAFVHDRSGMPDTPGEAGRSSERDISNGPPRRGQLAVFGSLLVLLLIFVFLNAYKLYRSSGMTPFIQGRYLYAAIVPFAVLVAVGASRLLRRWAPLAMLGAATLMQVDGVRVALRAWWAEPAASVSRSFDAMIAWNPVPRAFVQSLLFAVCITLGLTTYLLLQQARATDRGRSAATRPFGG